MAIGITRRRARPIAVLEIRAQDRTDRLNAGRLLAHYRMRAGWTQEELADRLCRAKPTLTRNDVSRWERGVRLPGRYWLSHISRLLDLPEHVETAIASVARQPTMPVMQLSSDRRLSDCSWGASWVGCRVLLDTSASGPAPRWTDDDEA